MWNEILILIIIPIFVRIVSEVFAYWLNKNDND